MNEVDKLVVRVLGVLTRVDTKITLTCLTPDIVNIDSTAVESRKNLLLAKNLLPLVANYSR